VIERGKRFAAHFMEADATDIVFSDGNFTIAGTDRTMPLEQIAQMSFIPVGLPSELGVGLQGAGAFSADVPSFPMAATSVKSRSTRRPERSCSTATPSSTTSARSSPAVGGRADPGGVAQGAGQALIEDVIYERDSGQLLTGSLIDYGIPRADTLPAITVDFSPVPSRSNPLGIKGVGEGGTVAATPTVMNAILDALAPLGVHDVPMPATPSGCGRRSTGHPPPRANRPRVIANDTGCRENRRPTGILILKVG